MKFQAQAFFSCSFDKRDKDLNAFFEQICKALDIHCVNVSGAYPSIPAEKARELITESDGLIAVATRRKALSGRPSFEMPPAVRDEISLGFALKKPLLLFFERGVNREGFLTGYATFLEFERDDLNRPEFVGAIVHSIYKFRSDAIDRNPPCAPEYKSLDTRGELTVSVEEGSFVWYSSIRKRLLFSERLQREISSAVWPCLRWKRPNPAPAGEWGFEIVESSRPFQIQKTMQMATPDYLEIRVLFKPPPEPNDVIEYTRWFKSPYLNPVYRDEMLDDAPPAVTLDDVQYSIYDGVAVTEVTDRLRYHCSFPAGYLDTAQVKPFCGERTFAIDRVLESEANRIAYRIVPYASSLFIDMEIVNPKPLSFYGVAWNLPTRSIRSGKSQLTTGP